MKRCSIVIAISLFCINLHAQYKTAIKTNVLLLPLSVWNAQVEHKIGGKWSIVGSYFDGTYIFISPTHSRGGHLLTRRYLGKKQDLFGFYGTVGLSGYGDYNNSFGKFNFGCGPRTGLGFQAHYKHLIMDTNIGGAIHMGNRRYTDSLGNPYKVFRLYPMPGIALSVGYVF